MKVLRSLFKRWRQLWYPGISQSTEIGARKWAEKIENLNRGFNKHH